MAVTGKLSIEATWQYTTAKSKRQSTHLTIDTLSLTSKGACLLSKPDIKLSAAKIQRPFKTANKICQSSQELSPYGVQVSGGDVTSARLFVKVSGNKETLGLVGFWDVVAWDEYEQQKGKSVDPVLIDTMQNYLANKSFNRGGNPHEASASISFVGNTKHTVSYMLDHSHLFESIPTAFIKSAFLDRIHLFNPGREVKILKRAAPGRTE